VIEDGEEPLAIEQRGVGERSGALAGPRREHDLAPDLEGPGVVDRDEVGASPPPPPVVVDLDRVELAAA